MISIYIWALVILCVLAFFGIIHFIAYVTLAVLALVAKNANDNSETKCPYFVEGQDDD